MRSTQALSSLVRSAPPATIAGRGRAGSTGSAARGDAAAAPTQECAWKIGHIAECDQRAGAASDPMLKRSYRALARVMSPLFSAHGHAWGTRDLIVPLRATSPATSWRATRSAAYRAATPAGRRTGRLWLAAAAGTAHRHQHQGRFRLGQEHPAAAAEEACGRDRRELERFCADQPGYLAQTAARLRLARGAYKYAGAFTAEELQIVDQKLDRYMARKYRAGRCRTC